MKHYLLVHNGKDGETVQLPVSGTVHEVESAEDAAAFLENGELLSAVILDTPSEIPGVDRLIGSVHNRNNDLPASLSLIRGKTDQDIRKDRENTLKAQNTDLE